MVLLMMMNLYAGLIKVLLFFIQVHQKMLIEMEILFSYEFLHEDSWLLYENLFMIAKLRASLLMFEYDAFVCKTWLKNL